MKPDFTTQSESHHRSFLYFSGWFSRSLGLRLFYRIFWLTIWLSMSPPERVFAALTSGDRIQVTSTIGVNVRQSPGGTPYANGQAYGALGVITGSPTNSQIGGTGTTYTWWYVDFDSSQDGWVATTGFGAIVPAPPTLVYPGDGSTVPTITTLTPTFQWNAVRGANGYGLYVQQDSSFPIDTDSIGNTTTYAVPAGVLQPGKSYVWNMRARDSAGFSSYSTGTTGRFYFQTPPAPSATTLSPSDVTSTSATLVGNLDANGVSTSYYFQYGLTTSYSSTTLAYSIGTGSGNYGISVSGLSASTTYHYRVVAYNTAITTYGDDVSFTTSPPPPGNDTFANRSAITALNLTVTGSSVSATKEAGEPNHAGIAGGKSVWWTWTPSASGSATISTAGSGFDTLLAVYTGSSVSALTSIASNDDDTAHGVATSLVTFNAVAGVAYQIAVDGNAGLSGSIQLTVTPPATGPAPIARISGEVRPVPGYPYVYDGTGSTGSGLSYAWSTSDGQSSTISKPQFAFNSTGRKYITLIATDSIGRTSTASIEVNAQASNNGTVTIGQTVGADPVVLSSGNYIAEHIDLRLPGKGFPFEFRRFYNSKFSDQSGFPLGFGWTHNFNERIQNTGANAHYIKGDGSTWTFFTNSTGFYGENGVFDSLVRNPNNTWSLIDKAQTVRLFDTNGMLLSITDKNGNKQSLHYEGPTLTKITDTVGRTILLNTNASGLISEIVDPIGRYIRFEYDQTNLVRVIDANQQTNRFIYTTNHQIADAFDAKGTLYLHNEYNPTNLVVDRQHDAFTNWTYFAYDFDNRITRQTNAAGKVSVHQFDHRLLITNIVDEAGNQQVFDYDADRNRTLVRDKNGNATRYGYDSRGNVTNKIDALTNVTTIEYDSLNNPTRRIDALTNTTAFGYDLRGNLTSTTNALGFVSRVQYDTDGLPIVLTDARGFSTTNNFDSQGNLVAVIDAKGFTNRFEFDSGGRKIRQIDALNRTNSFVFDNNDNLLFTTNALGFVNAFTFDANNNRITAQNPRGAVVTNVFDLKDRLIATLAPLNQTNGANFDALDRKITSFDALGNPTRFGFDDVGNLISVTNALGQITRFAFDPQGNQTSVIDPTGHYVTNFFDTLNRKVATIDLSISTNLTQFDALGRVIAVTNGNGQVTRFNFDAIGRLTNVVDAANQSVFFDYDKNGNRVRTTDPNSHSWTNVFDELNRLIEQHNPDGTKTVFTFDPVGNVTNKLTPNGDNIGYCYDLLNRLTNIAYPSGTPVSFAYDAGGNRTNMTDGLGATTWQFDVLNRLTSVTDPYGQTVANGFDANGNRTSLTYPGSNVVTYGFDALNRMTSLTNWLGGVVSYGFDVRGNLIAQTNANGTTVSFTHDVGGRLVALTNATSSASVIAAYALTLDAIGNHLQSAHEQPLFPILVNQTNSYGYDADNRLTLLDGQAVAHDFNGNLKAIGTNTTFTYDFNDRLVEFSVTNVSGSCNYDGLGNRLTRTVNGESRHFVLDRLGTLTQTLVETDTINAPIALYVYGAGLAQRITPEGQVATYHFNLQGSTVALTDSGGNVTDAYAYDSFGVLANAEGDCPQPFRYLGRYGIMDDGTGLYHARARYFSPQLGRFITKDPLTGTDSDGQSLNRYVYVLNNPLMRVDPSGMFSIETLVTAGFQFLSGVGNALGGFPIAIFLGAEASLKSGSIVPLGGAIVGGFDTVNESSKDILAAFVNVGGAFYNQPPLLSDETVGAFDNVLNLPGIKQVVAANKIYSIATSIRSVSGLVNNPQEARRFMNQLKSIVSDTGKFSFRLKGVGALQDIQEFYKTAVDGRDLIEALQALFGTGFQPAANTPILVEIVETTNGQPRPGKK